MPLVLKAFECCSCFASILAIDSTVWMYSSVVRKKSLFWKIFTLLEA
jgi:hypothetical protein